MALKVKLQKHNHMDHTCSNNCATVLTASGYDGWSGHRIFLGNVSRPTAITTIIVRLLNLEDYLEKGLDRPLPTV